MASAAAGSTLLPLGERGRGGPLVAGCAPRRSTAQGPAAPARAPSPAPCSLPSRPHAAALVDKCTGSRIWVMMQDNREIVGTLRGFDEYVNMVLDDAIE